MTIYATDGDVVQRVLQFVTETERLKKSHANHVYFDVHSKPFNSQLMKFQFCSWAGKSYRKNIQRTWIRGVSDPPHRKSRSFWCPTTEHSHSLRIDLNMFFSLCISLPLILHSSSPVYSNHQYILVHMTPLKTHSHHCSSSK